MEATVRNPFSPSRRGLLKASAAVSGAAIISAMGTNFAHAAGAAGVLKIGLIGCGARGRGAVANALEADAQTKLVALGDLFPDAMDDCLKQYADRPKDRYDLHKDRCFVGWDAYQKVLATDIDIVILATPPGFRPMMVKAAVEAGKHVFAEKPCAVCPTGVRMVLEAAELAEKKGLAFVGGTQRRHQASYIDVVKRLHDGAIGKLVAGHGYWMQGGLWMKPRKPEWSDMEWQVRNWAYFTWLSGDTLVEQAIHQVDVMNWVMGGPPRLAVGMGGRQVRTDPAYGHIYDHFAIDYEYPSGARVTLMSRQTDNAYNRIGESAIGTRGTAFPSGRIKPFEGEEYRYEGEGNNPLVQEHADLIASVRAGKPLNVGKRFAESILTGIMGRMSAYTGQPVTWDFALKSKLDLTPRKLEFGDAPMPPVAMPGVDKLI